MPAVSPFSVTVALVLLAVTSRVSAEEEATEEPAPAILIPDSWQIVFETTVRTAASAPTGVVKVNVTTAFAPLGAERLYTLVREGYYDEAPLFRVVPHFAVQWGLAAHPAVTARWVDKKLMDDPVEVSNEEGTVSFASGGKDTRTTQLFVNLVDNVSLDQLGFAPVGQVVEGLDIFRAAHNPTPGKTGGLAQERLKKEGIQWIRNQHPKTDLIKRAYIVH